MTTRPEARIRPVTPGDLTGLLGLMAEHAAFERGQASVQPWQLSRALFEPPARLFGWVACDGADLLGYAAASREFSAWRGDEHLHMDGLFVSAAARNRGLGARLVEAVVGFARTAGLPEIQWQTPAWNLDATRFYERLGAVGKEKVRFSFDCSPAR
ncbi:GNAT family N-acetyltransferase [Phenylobacterium sp.]|uniref:GNAT family N-acetyltransferase n=1 Tax=Phenylobacterium sp. TaxID=1871053 RepID=UPI0030F489FB